MRSERGVYPRQGRALGTNSLINPKGGPNGVCLLPWTRGRVPQLSETVGVSLFTLEEISFHSNFKSASTSSEGGLAEPKTTTLPFKNQMIFGRWG